MADQTPKRRRKSGPKGPIVMTADRKDAAVAFMRANFWNMPACASAIGVSLRTLNRHYAEDPDFRDRMVEARGDFLKQLEAEAWRRGVEGVEHTVGTTKDGEAVVTIKYSDQLLLHMLKVQGRGEHTDHVRIDQHVEGKVEHEHSGRIEVEKLTPEQRRKAREFLSTLDGDDPLRRN